jgi:acyl-CoA synthetase (AMP-forming)/AMP-acid ligase II
MPATLSSNLPSHPVKEPTLLPHLVEIWAQQAPAAPAISYGEAGWTFGQWWERIGRVTAALTDAGIGRGDRIAFLDKNHPACLELTFAAASLGAAITILNWRLSTDEVAYALRDSGSRLLVAGEEFADLAAAAVSQAPGVERVISLAEAGPCEYEEFLAGHEPRGVSAKADPEDAALVIYSSGTTGRPKGVVLSQRALIAHTRAVGTSFPYVTGDLNLIAMPMFHVGGICWGFFNIWVGNEGLVLRNPDAPSLLAAFGNGVTHTFLVPPVISGLLAAGEQVHGALGGLKYVGYGAAPMPEATLRQALQTWPHINFVQVYGQTEVCGVTVTLDPEDHRDLERSHLLVSAGRPVPGVELRITDPVLGTEVDDGEQGEIWLRCDHVMTGYLNRPEDTAETVTEDGWLRTGDIGRVDAEGFLYVEDRIKDMIITGGENVYGPEVERVLMEHPKLKDGAIIGVPHEKWGEAVKAVVVAEAGTTEDEVIGFCREHLATFKCPLSVDFVDEIPRNASGKILKRDLRAPYWAGSARRI